MRGEELVRRDWPNKLVPNGKYMTVDQETGQWGMWLWHPRQERWARQVEGWFDEEDRFRIQGLSERYRVPVEGGLRDFEYWRRFNEKGEPQVTEERMYLTGEYGHDFGTGRIGYQELPLANWVRQQTAQLTLVEDHIHGGTPVIKLVRGLPGNSSERYFRFDAVGENLYRVDNL